MRGAVSVVCVLWAAVAVAQGQTSGWEKLQLGKVVSEASAGNFAYLALETGGVAIVDVSDRAQPKVVGRLAEDRLVSSVFISGGVLHLVEVRQEVSSYSLATPQRPRPTVTALVNLPSGAPPSSTTPTPSTPSAPPQTPPESGTAQAKVVEVVNGRAIFDGGAKIGFTPGRRVRVLSQQLVEKPNLSGQGNIRVPSGDQTAVVRIEQADDDRAMAVLGRGDVAAQGDLVELTDEPLSESIFVPRRAPFTYRAGFLFRPFLGLQSLSASKPVGFLLDAFATYYFELPIAIDLSVSPFGFSFGSYDRHYPTTIALTAAYATDYFEIGLGGGALIGSAGPCGFTPLGGSAGSCEANTGFTVNQVLRLGALDGLNLRWQSSIFSRPDRFVFGVGRAEVNIPLTSRIGLFGGGGGGENGWNFGEFGVKSYLGGAGAVGTLILSASLGYASIFDGPTYDVVGGPAVAFGMEWRR